MKIKLGKLLNILNQVAVAVPAIVQAVAPVVRAVKGSKAHEVAGPPPNSTPAGRLRPVRSEHLRSVFRNRRRYLTSVGGAQLRSGCTPARRRDSQPVRLAG